MRNGDLLGAVEDGALERLAHRQVAVDVLDLDVASSTRMPTASARPAERHDVERLPEGSECDDATRIDSGMLIVTISVLASSRGTAG
jgi:hypothetical protein